MRYKIILVSFFMIWFIQGFSQKIDTLYWSEAANKHDINEIREIILAFNDSTFKTIKYWEGKITSIEYAGIVNGCLTPIKTDTLFVSKENEIKIIIRNEVRLNNSSVCDSLLLVQHIKKYKKGQLIEELVLKRVGQFADCPCGKWKFYENNKLMDTMEFDSCYDRKLSNLTLIETVWSPNNKFMLELYKEQMLFAMPGQGSDHMATIILKNENGEIINYISSNSDESTMYRDIRIEWNLDKGIVWYGKARLFKLK